MTTAAGDAGRRGERSPGGAGSAGGDRLADVVAAVAGATTVAAMIATPLLPTGGRGRRRLSSIVVTAMFATTSANAARRWGWRRSLGAAGLTAVATGAVERIGTATGFPFGRYAYADALRPQVAHVPVIVPLAWFAMGLPSREVAHAALGARSTRGRRIALGAAAMTAWDLFLDPQMVGEGYWAWARRGRYRGIPASNFLGWFATSAALVAAFERLLPTSRPGTGPSDPRARRHDRDRRADRDDRARAGAEVRLVAQYGYVSVMQTLGFARFFRDPLVAVVGGAAMLPTAITAAVSLGVDRGERR